VKQKHLITLTAVPQWKFDKELLVETIQILNACVNEDVANVKLSRDPSRLESGHGGEVDLVIDLANTAAATVFLRGLFAYLIQKESKSKSEIKIKLGHATLQIPASLDKRMINSLIKSFYRAASAKKPNPDMKTNSND
jgi:hypothetical protein